MSAIAAAGRFNAKVLPALMGHSSTTVTFDRYGQLMPGSEIEAAAGRRPRRGCRRQRPAEP